MAVLDPTQTYTNGQLVYFRAEPISKYNANYKTIQGAEFQSADPVQPLTGGLLSAINPWQFPTGIYMKGTSLAVPNNLNGKTVPSDNVSTDFSAVPKAWWADIQSRVDGVDVLQANFANHDTLPELNGEFDTYAGYSPYGCPVCFGEYYNPSNPTMFITIKCVADYIEPNRGGDFISADMRNSTQRQWKLIMVCFDRINSNDELLGRYYFWCFIDSNNVVQRSIRWNGGTLYDSSPEDGGDPMGWAELPNADFIKTGMCRAYCFDGSSSSIHALNSLSSYLWGGTIYAQLDQICSNPMDCVIALNQLPSWSDYNKGGDITLKIGNLSVPKYDNTLTDETATSLSREWYTVDCGSITVPTIHGNYLDYEPFTQVDLFLPYIGMVKISPKDIVGKSIYIRYNIDALTGQCCCQIGDDNLGTHILYSFNGNCLTQFPLQGSNYSNIIGGAFALVGGALGGGVAKTIEGAVGGLGQAVQGGLSMFDSDHQRGGSISCTAGELGGRTPYVVVTTRLPIVDANYNTYAGQPYFKTATLNSVTGFTIVEQVQLNGVVATQGELDEIESLLKGGVIL